jgi:hypothetical protein
MGRRAQKGDFLRYREVFDPVHNGTSLNPAGFLKSLPIPELPSLRDRYSRIDGHDRRRWQSIPPATVRLLRISTI